MFSVPQQPHQHIYSFQAYNSAAPKSSAATANAAEEEAKKERARSLSITAKEFKPKRNSSTKQSNEVTVKQQNAFFQDLNESLDKLVS